MRKGIMAMEGLEQELDTPPPAGEEGGEAAAGGEGAVEGGEAARTEEDAVRDEVAEVTSFVDAPEGDLAEAADVASEVEQTTDSIDEATSTVETLDEIGDAVEASIEEGGLSEPAARGIEVAIEHLRTQVGFPKGRKFMPALEGFADSKSRIGQTKLALESIRDTANKVGAAIVAAFNRAVEWIIKFYEHVMDGAKGLAARAEALAQKAASVEGKQAGAGVNVSASSFGKTLAVNGAFVEGQSFVGKFGEALKQTAELGEAQMNLAKQGQVANGKIYSAKSMEEVETLAMAALKTIGQYSIGQQSASKSLGGVGYTVLEEKLVFGGQSFYSVFPSTDNQVGKAGQVQWTVGPTTGGKEAGDIGEVQPLSAKDIVAVAKAAAEHLKGYASFNEGINAVKKANAEIQAAAKKEEGSVASHWGKNALASLVIKSYIKAMTQGAQKLRSYDLMICKAGLTYAGASLKALAGIENDL